MSELRSDDYPRNGNTNPLYSTDDNETLPGTMRAGKSLLDVVGPYRGPTWQQGEGQDSQLKVITPSWAMREHDLDSPNTWVVKGHPPKELLVTRSKYTPKVDERVEVLTEGLRKLPVSRPKSPLHSIGFLDSFNKFSNPRPKSPRRPRGRLQYLPKDCHVNRFPELSKLLKVPTAMHNGVTCRVGWLPEEYFAELSTYTDVDTWIKRIWFVQHKPRSPIGCPQTHGSAQFWESCDAFTLSSKTRTFVLKVSGPLPPTWGESGKRCIALQDKAQDAPSTVPDTRMEDSDSFSPSPAPVEKPSGPENITKSDLLPQKTQNPDTMAGALKDQISKTAPLDTTSSLKIRVQKDGDPSSTLPSPPSTEANSPAPPSYSQATLAPPPSDSSSRRSSTDESLPDATDSDISYGTESEPEPESDIEDIRAVDGQSPGSDGSYVVIDFENQSGMQSHGAHSHNHGDSSTSSSGGSHFHPYQDRGMGLSGRTGRRRSAGGGDEDDKGRKRPRRNDDRRGSGSSNNSRRRLACPYYRFDPKNPEHMRCKDKSWPTLARVKGHVLRSHLRPLQCERCCKFRAGDRGQISNHLKGGNCEKAEFVPMDSEVERKGNDLSRGASRTWAQVCMVLFDCGLDSVPPAYVDDELSAPSTSPPNSSPVPPTLDDPLEAIFQSPGFQAFVQQNLVAVLGEVLPGLLAQQMPLLISKYRESQQSASVQTSQEIHSSRTPASASASSAATRRPFVDQSPHNPEPAVFLPPLPENSAPMPSSSTSITSFESFDQVAFLNPFESSSADFDALTYDFGGIPPDMASFENGGMEIDEDLASFDAFRGDEFEGGLR